MDLNVNVFFHKFSMFLVHGIQICFNSVLFILGLYIHVIVGNLLNQLNML